MWNVCMCKSVGVNSLGSCSKCGGAIHKYTLKTKHENDVMLNPSMVIMEIMIKDRINELKSKLQMQSKVKMSTTYDEFKIANLEIRIDELEQLLNKIKK